MNSFFLYIFIIIIKNKVRKVVSWFVKLACLLAAAAAFSLYLLLQLQVSLAADVAIRVQR